MTALTQHNAKLTCTSSHLTAFNTLKSALLEAPLPYYPDPSKQYIVYMDALDDACGSQLLQEHDGQELPVAFHSHTCMDTQHKWSTAEQEPYAFTMQWPNETTIYKDLTLFSTMTTSLYKNF